MDTLNASTLSATSSGSNKPPRLCLQTIPQACARLCLQVEKTLQRLDLKRPLRLLLALSGGADSTALASIFALLAPRRKDTLFAASVNHGLRPEAEAEVAGTQALCRQLGIASKSVCLDVKGLACQQKMGLEEAARKLRYAFLEEERLALGADYIVTAHHADDLTEDILMRLVRGSGWPALGGMCDVDPQRHLLRPLLGLKKRALTDMLRALDLAWFEDASNQDLRFTRNRFRQTLVPLLEKENPNLSATFAHLHTLADYDADFWQNYLTEALDRFGYDIQLDSQRTQITLSFSKALLTYLHPAARLRLYRYALQGIASLRRDQGHASPEACASQFFSLEDCVAQGQGGKTILFPGSVRVLFQKGSLHFYAAL